MRGAGLEGGAQIRERSQLVRGVGLLEGGVQIRERYRLVRALLYSDLHLVNIIGLFYYVLFI